MKKSNGLNKVMVLAFFIIMLIFLLCACGSKANSKSTTELPQDTQMQNTQAETSEPANIQLELTYPVGESPKVFTKGWVFGAKCLLNPGTSDEKDVSTQIVWSGSASYSQTSGALNWPTFNNEGENTITLTYQEGDYSYTQSYNVNCVSPSGYAYEGIYSHCPADSHGCTACPHDVKGPILSGSELVNINGHPAARVGDVGIHSSCCGENTFEIITGDPEVLIDGRPAARIGDSAKHCGGMGVITSEYTEIGTLSLSPESFKQNANESLSFEAVYDEPAWSKSIIRWSLNDELQGTTEGKNWDVVIQQPGKYTVKAEVVYQNVVIAKAFANGEILPASQDASKLKVLQASTEFEAYLICPAIISIEDAYANPTEQQIEEIYSISILPIPIQWQNLAFSGTKAVLDVSGATTNVSVKGEVTEDGTQIASLTYEMVYEFPNIEKIVKKLTANNLPIQYYGDLNQFIDQTSLNGQAIGDYISLVTDNQENLKDGAVYASKVLMKLNWNEQSTLTFMFK